MQQSIPWITLHSFVQRLDPSCVTWFVACVHLSMVHVIHMLSLQNPTVGWSHAEKVFTSSVVLESHGISWWHNTNRAYQAWHFTHHDHDHHQPWIPTSQEAGSNKAALAEAMLHYMMKSPNSTGHATVMGLVVQPWQRGVRGWRPTVSHLNPSLSVPHACDPKPCFFLKPLSYHYHTIIIQLPHNYHTILYYYASQTAIDHLYPFGSWIDH